MTETTRRKALELLLASQAAGIAAAQQHAHRQSKAAGPGKLQSLSPADAAEVEALAALIIPSSEGSPGARETGAIHFIDRALATFDRDKRAAYRDGLAMVRQKRREMFPASVSLAALPPADQLTLAKAIESTPFFEMVRVHTIVSFFGHPQYGGNRGEAGWKLIGFQG